MFCWLGTVLLANDYVRTLVCGYPCGWEVETIGCLLRHLQPLLTVVFVPTAAAVSSCHLLWIPEIQCRTCRYSVNIHLPFIVNFKNFVSLVKIKLNEQGTVNAQNIFNTITEESDIKFANQWWSWSWNMVFKSPWACWHTRTFLALILTVANLHSMKLNSTYLQCTVVIYTQACSPCTWASDFLSMITHAAIITIYLLNKH